MLKTYDFSTVHNSHDTLITPRTKSLDSLAESLRIVGVGPKDGTAIIPAVFHTPRRNSQNVHSMTMLCLDLDSGITLIDAMRATSAFKRIGWETYNHSYEHPKCRLLLPFEVPFSLHNGPARWSQGAWPQLIKALGLEKCADKSCSNPDRLYFMPRKPAIGDVRQVSVGYGVDLDWRKYVDLTIIPTCDTKVVATASQEDLSRSVYPEDLERTKRRLEGYAQRCTTYKKTALLNILANKMPAKLPGERAVGEPSRNEMWLFSTYALAMCSEDWIASDALLTILKPAWNDEVSRSPDDFTPWTVIGDMLKRARIRAIQKHQQDEKIWSFRRIPAWSQEQAKAKQARLNGLRKTSPKLG